MDSDKIKVIVAEAKALTRGEASPEPIMDAMVKDMGRSPTFAVAIIQHLREEGYDLLGLSGEAAERFKAKFKPTVERLGERELAQIKKISDKLFSA